MKGLRSPRRLVASLVLLALGAGGVTYRLTERTEHREAMSDFQERVTEEAAAIESAGLTLSEVLHGFKAFFDSSDEVEQQEFSTFAEGPLARYPAVRMVAWAPVVPQVRRRAYEERAQTAGAVHSVILERDERGRLQPAGRRPTYFPVRFARPRSGDPLPVGFDLGSEARHYRAIERCLRTKDPVLSESEASVARPPEGRLCLLFHAVLHRAGNREGRPTGSFAGLLVLAFAPTDLVEDVVGTLAPGLPRRVEVSAAGGATDTAVVLAASPGFSRAPASVKRSIRLGGQTWTLLSVPTERFLEARATRWPLVLGLLAALLAAGLAAAAFLIPWRRHQLALRRQDDLMRAVLASVGEGVMVADQDRQILFANPAAQDLAGVRVDQSGPGLWSSTFGFRVSDQEEAPYPEEHLPLVRALLGETIPEEEMWIRNPKRPEGRWLSVSGAPLRKDSGAVEGGVVVFRDVTARRQQEAELRQLSEAVEQTADAVFICDREGAVTYVNPAFEAITGYSRDEAIGKQAGEVGLAGDHPDLFRRFREAAETMRVSRVQARNRRQDGTTYESEHTITPMRDGKGRITHFVGVCRDVSERRRLEEQKTEMLLASEVQRRLYPESAPRFGGFDLAGAVYSADATCGDYFDFIPLSDDLLAIAIGDVSGHGLGPALVMTQVRAYLRAFLEKTHDVAEVFQRINRALAADLDDGLFVTLIVGVLDRRTRRLQYANAGHVPGFVFDASGHVIAQMPRTGVPLGLFQDSIYRAGPDRVLAPGETLAFITDGVTESRDANGECLWEEGATRLVAEQLHRPAREIVDRLYDGVRAHAGESIRQDDVTMLVCKSLAVPEEDARAVAERASGLGQEAFAPTDIDGTICRRAT